MKLWPLPALFVPISPLALAAQQIKLSDITEFAARFIELRCDGSKHSLGASGHIGSQVHNYLAGEVISTLLIVQLLNICIDDSWPDHHSVWRLTVTYSSRG